MHSEGQSHFKGGEQNKRTSTPFGVSLISFHRRLIITDIGVYCPTKKDTIVRAPVYIETLGDGQVKTEKVCYLKQAIFQIEQRKRR